MWEILRRPLQIGLDPRMPAAGAIAPASRTPDGEIELLGEALRVEVQRLFAGLNLSNDSPFEVIIIHEIEQIRSRFPK